MTTNYEELIPKKVLLSIKDLNDYISEDTLNNIYQVTSDLIFFSHYTKADIDGMLPFERNIFIGILNKTKEKLNEA